MCVCVLMRCCVHACLSMRAQARVGVEQWDVLPNKSLCKDRGDPSHVPWLGVSVCVLVWF